MTATIPRPQLSSTFQQDYGFWLASLVCICAFWFLLLSGQLNLICALMVGSLLALAAIRKPAAGAILTLAYLHLLGDIRRLADVATGVPGLDLLLLVGPALALMLALPALLRLQVRDNLSKAMLWLTILMVLQIFNPAQGGIAVGFSGAMFYLVPVLWFWVGRRLASPLVIERLFYYAIFPIATAAAILGLYQNMVGFFPYEQAWINATINNYMALSLNGTVRAFGFSVSSAEYATLLELAAAGVIAAWFGTRRIWILAFPLLLGAMLMASGRTVVIKLVFALAVVFTLKGQREMKVGAMVRLGVLLLGGLVGVSAIASHYAPSGDSSGVRQSATENAISHLSGGLAHPFDEKYSTVGIHQGMFTRAILQGFTSPLGRGLGASTGASAKFASSAETYSSEVDLSDMFMSLGAAGGLLYAFILITALKRAAIYTRQTPRLVGLPLMAVLCATMGAWLIAGQYSTSALVFFLIGATTYTERPVVEATVTAREAEAFASAS